MGLDDAEYVCSACHETIVVEVDPSGGSEQEYVEDCPVCCRPQLLRVHIGREGDVWLEARGE